MATVVSSNIKNKVQEHRLLTLWKKWGGSVVGRRIFNLIFSRFVPYSGSIKSQIIKLEPGHVVVELKDRKSIRNHLNCIHAIALANLGELSSGLAMIAAVPSDIRAIVVNLEIEYLKKARGKLIAEGKATPPETITESVSSVAISEIKDAENDIVARVTVHWLLSPKPDQQRKQHHD